MSCLYFLQTLLSPAYEIQERVRSKVRGGDCGERWIIKKLWRTKPEVPRQPSSPFAVPLPTRQDSPYQPEPTACTNHVPATRTRAHRDTAVYHSHPKNHGIREDRGGVYYLVLQAAQCIAGFTNNTHIRARHWLEQYTASSTAMANPQHRNQSDTWGCIFFDTSRIIRLVSNFWSIVDSFQASLRISLIDHSHLATTVHLCITTHWHGHARRLVYWPLPTFQVERLYRKAIYNVFESK